MTLAHYVRRICGQFWLVLETRNDASGFLFWRHCGYVGHRILFIISEPAARWKFLKHGEHVPFIKRKRLRILSDFSCDFAKFLGYISLYVLFLKNGSMNHIEIWPRALPNYCVSIPIYIYKIYDGKKIYDGRNYCWALIVHDYRCLKISAKIVRQTRHNQNLAFMISCLSASESINFNGRYILGKRRRWRLKPCLFYDSANAGALCAA